MSSSSATSGIKRSAAADWSSSSAATVQQQKRHRPSSKHKSKLPTNDFHLDLICKIASFVDIGGDLMNLLVAFGPTECKTIRRNYLQNNDAYLVKSLGICRNAMAPAIRLSHPNSSNVLNLYQLSAKRFHKCRDNIMAWMDVNANWRSRCTRANMTKYRRPLQEANLIFNNPVVAIEIGLVEVLDHLINEMGADVCDTDCKGFVADAASSHRGMDNFVFNPIMVALYRKDTEILQTLLSSNTIRTGTSSGANRLLNHWDILHYCFKENKIRKDVFKTLVASPKIDVNTTDQGFHCLHCFVLQLHRFMNRLHHREDSVADFMLSRISALLNAGSNPHVRINGDIMASSAFRFALAVKGPLVWRKGDSPLDEWRCDFWDRLYKKLKRGNKSS